MPADACPFVWYELMTTDTAAAESFYRQAVGWNAADAGMPGVKYTIVSAGSTGIGGLMALPDDAKARGVPPNWTGYVGVADVDAMAERVRAAGGSIHHPPGDIPGVGRFAVVADPHGAVLCLFKGNRDEQPPQPPAGTPGTIGWHELYADDLDAAWGFYSTLFGWTKADAIDMGPEMGVYQLFVAAGPEPIGGMMKRPPQVPMACWLYYVNVDAIDAAVERVTAGGGKVVNGPMEVPGGSWIAQCVDPQGAMFAMVAPRR
jgi:predicted enzyme related to lactoylglutathione lyase